MSALRVGIAVTAAALLHCLHQRDGRTRPDAGSAADGDGIQHSA